MSSRQRKRQKTQPESPARISRPDLYWLAALVVIATGLRLHHLGQRDLWLDESMSYFFARADLAELPRLLRFDSGPPLYYALLHVWTKLAGVSEIALRSLSTLWSVLLVPGLYLVGQRFFHRGVGLAAAFFAALTPIQVYYGQEARGYTLLALLALTASFFLWRWLEEPSPRDLVAYAAALAAAFYVHNYAFFLALTHGLLVASIRPPRRSWIHLGAAWVGVGVAYLPWLPIFRQQLSGKGSYEWMALVWEEGGFLGSLQASLSSLAPGGAQPKYIALEPWIHGATPPLLLISALLGLGLYRTFRDRKERPVASIGLLISTLAPPLLVATVSWARDPIYLPGRLEQMVVPFYCLALAHGVEAIRPRLARLGVLTVFAVLALWTLAPYYDASEPGGDRELASALAPRLQPGDVILTTSVTRAPLEYNLRHRSDIRWVSFPAEVAQHPGNFDIDTLLEDRPGLEKEAAALLSGLATDSAWSGRVVLIATPDAITGLLISALTQKPRARRDEVIGEYQLSRVGFPLKVFLLDYSPR